MLDRSNINVHAHFIQNPCIVHSFLLSLMSLRVAAKLIRKHTKSLIKSLFNIQHEYSPETFLHHCELVQPSEYLVTGGALMEFFIMAFGSEDDSRLLYRYTSPRKQIQVIRSQTRIQHLMRQYTLR